MPSPWVPCSALGLCLPFAKHKLPLRVGPLRLWVEFFIEQARLDVAVVLILVARVFGDVADNLMIEDLADRHAGIDANRLDREHLERPIAAKPHIAKAGRDMHEEP